MQPTCVHLQVFMLPIFQSLKDVCDGANLVAVLRGTELAGRGH